MSGDTARLAFSVPVQGVGQGLCAAQSSSSAPNSWPDFVYRGIVMLKHERVLEACCSLNYYCIRYHSEFPELELKGLLASYYIYIPTEGIVG